MFLYMSFYIDTIIPYINYYDIINKRIREETVNCISHQFPILSEHFHANVCKLKEVTNRLSSVYIIHNILDTMN